MTTIETCSEQETFSVGQAMGSRAGKGDIFCLDGELGVGKTVFAQGFAKGLGILEPISSPTFTIVQEYKEGRIPLYHFDAYRIAHPEEMEEIGYEDYFLGEGVCLIEWASLIEEILPEHSVFINIEKDLQKGFDYRRIIVRSFVSGGETGQSGEQCRNEDIHEDFRD